MPNATKMTAIDVEELYINGQKVEEFGGTAPKLPPISPLKADADNTAIVKKINEIIASMKLAGIMENK